MILTWFQELFESPRRAGLQASGHQTSFMSRVFHDSKQFVWCWNYTFGLFLFLHINLWLMILSRTCPILGFHRSVRLRFDTWCLAHSVSRLKVLLWEGWQEGDFLYVCGCPNISKNNVLFPQDGGAPVVSGFITPSRYNYRDLDHTLLLS